MRRHRTHPSHDLFLDFMQVEFPGRPRSEHHAMLSRWTREDREARRTSRRGAGERP